MPLVFFIEKQATKKIFRLITKYKILRSTFVALFSNVSANYLLSYYNMKIILIAFASDMISFIKSVIGLGALVLRVIEVIAIWESLSMMIFYNCIWTAIWIAHESLWVLLQRLDLADRLTHAVVNLSLIIPVNIIDDSCFLGLNLRCISLPFEPVQKEGLESVIFLFSLVMQILPYTIT